MTETYVAWAVSAVAILLVGVLLGVNAISRGPLGVLIDERGRFSLTRMQLALWTLVVLSLIAAVFWGRLRAGENDALGFTIPSELLVVLGISLGSTVTASTIKSVKDTTNGAGIAASNTDDRPRLAQMFLVEEGTNADKVIDITKFQNFWITLILVTAYVCLAIDWINEADGPANLTELPGFSTGFTVLLAISHGGYIIAKVPNKDGTPDGLTVAGLRDGAQPTTTPPAPLSPAQIFMPRNPPR